MAKVLIVEDNILISHHLKSLLVSAGFEAHIIMHGEKVDGFVRDNKPDLVLMDVMLAGAMDGIEATEQLRTHSNIPVIFISALTNYESKQKLIGIPNLYFFRKPFDEVAVVKMANSLVKGSPGN